MSESRFKFRAWDTSNNNFGMSEPFNIGDDPAFLLSDGDGYVLQGLKNCIVLQYTGLKDKNGTEIYEGDILVDGAGYTTVVEWGNGSWVGRGQPLDISEIIEFGVELAGNIYSHPELLEIK